MSFVVIDKKEDGLRLCALNVYQDENFRLRIVWRCLRLKKWYGGRHTCHTTSTRPWDDINFCFQFDFSFQ